MDLRWDRAHSIRPQQDQTPPPLPPQEQTEAWESNSSDDTSVGDYDGADMMMMPQPDVDIDDELAYEFPREDLAVLLEGLNKWPWTVYPIHLRNCLTSAAKLASLNIEDASSELRRLQTLYREAVPSAFEKCLDDKAIWKWNDEIHNNIFDALCRLMDLVVAKLPQLLLEDCAAMDDLLPLLRSLALGFDKQSQYHMKHKEQFKPSGNSISGSLIGLGMASSTKFARPLPASPATKKGGDWYCPSRKASVRDADGCECTQCRPPDAHFSRLSYLLNYFGQTAYGNGYHQLLKILSVPHKLFPALLEAVLLIVSKAAEFLLDDLAEAYIEPCNKILTYISDKLDSDVDALSDKTRDGSFAALSSILKHLQIIIARSMSSERSETVVSVVQRKLVERMLSFHSFNKHLSAVREINKLLENARFISSSDSPDAVRTTIQWLERMDILHKVLKSHLHHKQYVDQVQKIMKFLLQEKKLSEDHLDAIWAATEKPDQFETVKSNIFDLIADLAWSFSSDQLDSLFERLERSQGQSASDVVRILSFMKKLARSDNNGVMASRLLELLWKMTMADGAPGEIMESGAFTEILGHYDSINCASKDVYISRCILNLKEDKAVILSLRLLRDLILLDNGKPFYQNDISKMRLQQLIKDHDLFNMVVSSLEKYSLKASQAGFSRSDGSCSSHEEQVKERLDFLLFILQSSGVSFSWETSERLWNCMIESPVSGSDKESGFSWFCEALDKWSFLSLDVQFNILTKKMIKLDPSSLSQSAWRCFLRLFLWVNQMKEKLKTTESDDPPVTHDLDLVGLPYLWQIAFFSPVELIVEQSNKILREIYTCLSDSLQEDLVGIRQRFIDKCIGFLEKTLELGVLKCPETSDCSSSVKCSMAEVSGESIEKAEEKDPCVSTSPLETRIPRSYPFLMDSACMPEFRQVENCLRILQNFIIRCEGRCPRSIPPHTASFQGRPFILGVTTANKQSTRFDVTVHTNEYLSTLRAKVAKFLDNPVSRVRLTYLNRDLVHDSQVLWQCGLIGGQTISAAVNLVERITKHVDEKHLPGILISKNTKFYDTLFKLTNFSEASVREAANMLLSLLPTHPAILEDFYNLHEKDVEDSRLLLMSHFADQSRLLYSLQVLDGLVMPVNRPVDAQTLKFRKSFLEAGGIQHLLAILQPGALPENVDNQMRRGCYASCLRLLKFLISEKLASEEIALREVNEVKRKNASSKVKVDSDIDSEDVQTTKIVETQAKVNLDVIDMSSIVCALRRITWVAAIGQLSEMGKPFPVNAVLGKQTRKSAKKRSFPDDGESGLDPEDQYLCFEALDFLMLCLSKHKYLWSSFFTSSETDSFIVAMILHSPDKSVRYRAALNLMKLCSSVRQGADRIAFKQVLTALLGAKAEAAQHPKRCQHYWELLAHLFFSLEGTEEHEIAFQQLEDELQWLNSAPAAVDDDDRLLEGHLHLIKVLIDLLDKRTIGAEKNQHGRDLIQLLINDFLFPDSAMLLREENSVHTGKMQEVQFGVFGASPEEDGLLQAKCSTRASREKAFQLLLCLATHCKESFQKIVELILKIHLSEQVLDWEHLPSYGRKAIGGYVGLKNAGATCYMNSVFQQLFMQPEVRRSVLACTECDDIEKAGSVFFQLQAMFGALLGSSLDHYTPQGFWCAYRDYDGMPINLREHQDAFEFFNRLYDSIDETLKATHQETTLTRIFGGVFAQQVICRGCPHRSEREEPFAAISVDVKNKKDLLESLEAFVRGDLLEGDNAYYCDECGIKVDALKRVCVKSLPHTLVIHLKRFDFDYETMQRLKLKDRFEFPIHIDMKPYTVEGLTLREMQNPSPRTANDTHFNTGLTVESVCELFKPDMYYQYDLVGVVVHSGTAFAGHYYSYIKQRPGDHPLSCDHGQTGGWIAFDDKNVEPYDVSELEKDCFGGKYTVDVYDNFLKTTSPQELDRPNSAYMLFYERSQCEVSSLSQTEPIFPKDENGDASMKEISICERLPSLKNIQMPASVHRSVWQENLRFIHENNLMDKDYFRFLFRLAEINYDLIEGNASRSSHKTAEVGQDHRVDGVKDSEYPESLTEEVAGEFSKIIITLSIEFLLRVYLRMHANFREDLPLWKSLMCRMFEKSMISCRSFMLALSEQRHWIQEYLIRCPVEEIQQVFACLLIQALRCSVSYLNGNSLYVDANGRSIDAFHIDSVIDVLLSFLRDPVLPKYACHQYFQVILEYANFGAAQRFHLLQKSALSQLVNTTVNFATKVNFQMAKLDFACLHSLVSILLRNCDTSQFQLANLTSDGEGEDHVDNPPLPLPNPLQLPPPLFPLSKEAGDAVFKQHVYISVLLETCPEHEEAVKLLEFCCWNNESYTMWALQDLLDSLHRAVNNEIKPLLALMLRILLLEDSLQKMRQKVLLLGHENSRAGVMALIVTRVMNSQKRYLLLKFMVKLVNMCPATRIHLLGRRSDWKCVVDWLQEEIHSHGIGSGTLNTSISNEDMSNGHLQRTNSAEWTLLNARNVLGT